MTPDNLTHIIEQLSDVERKLLEIKANEVLINKTRTANPETKKRIVAYLKTKNKIDQDALKTYLKQSLPDYMIPSSIHTLDNIPLLPNGKVDKNELANTIVDDANFNIGETSITKPKNQTETTLVEIWEDVLGFSPISTNDNFFEIGGDSILSIQIVAKARKAGIHLKANQIFENQTISELAMFTSNENNVASKTKDNVEFEGEVTLTPVQHWYFETHKNAPHFWNQIIELENINNLSCKALEIITKQLISNHDALRLSFNKDGNKWQAYIKPSNQIKSFCEYHLETNTSSLSQNNEIESILLEIQENINIAKDSLFKFIFINCNGVQPNKIILIAHHLVIDLVSWNILVNEIKSSVKNIFSDFIFENNHNKTASVVDWANYLNKITNDNALIDELSFWKSQNSNTKDFPTDFSSNSKVFFDNSIIVYTSKLNKEQTKSLIYDANEAYGTKVEDLLITALTTTLCSWGNLEHLLLGLERQGRNTKNIGIDVSNTVGWFTSFFPIALNYNKSENLSHQITTIKERLRSIPNNGIGFGVLKYLSNIDTSDLNELQPKVIFNYFGKTSTNENNELIFKFLESTARDASSEQNYEIEINIQIVDDHLIINWGFTNVLYKHSTAEMLANKFIDNLSALIDYCKTRDDTKYTPSDFPEADINQDDLDNLLSQF